MSYFKGSALLQSQYLGRHFGQFANCLWQRDNTTRAVPVLQVVRCCIGVTNLSDVGASVGKAGIHMVKSKKILEVRCIAIEEPGVEEFQSIALNEAVNDKFYRVYACSFS